METKITEPIKKISVQISKDLYNEIKYAQDNLNKEEKKKCSGKKKYGWNFLEASHNLSKFLKNKRTK